MGTSCSAPGLRRDREEVAVTVAGAMAVRCRDGLPDGGRGAGGKGGDHAESGRCSRTGTIGALNPAGSGCDRAGWAVNGLLFPTSGHKMPL